ncbi:metastasis suppressor protein 1-like isoform X1 [Xyrichtys novacula]|uniref:Metastasis suppressor protein 1-like isoform X1 n=1 Tax=Xyrichtys novacula TaxID=13765 RepID=A0AAV1ESZ0_XYRNO|nr:metastasis suppressor protein 1-like isoform X1 [Xyrichtys novacula]
MGGSVRQLPSHTATIRRKPSSKPAYRRGTISGGVPIPISTPQVPLKALAGNGGSDENVFAAPPPGGAGLGYSKLCTSTQSLSALPPSSSSSSSSPYYQLVPGQMPIPVPVPTVPSLPQEGSNTKLQQQREYQQQLQHQQQQLRQQMNHQQQSVQIQQYNQQVHIQQQQQQQYQQFQQQQQYQHFQQQQQQQQQYQQFQQQQQQQPQFKQPLLQQQELSQLQKQKLFQQHQADFQAPAPAPQIEPTGLSHGAHYQPQLPPPSSLNQIQNQSQDQPIQDGGEGGGGGNMLSQIRGVRLKRTVTNDRSAPLLPPPANHK